MNSEVVTTIRNTGILPVININNIENTIPLINGLLEEGIYCAEITFRTPLAFESINFISKNFPNFIIGSGTVISKEQVDLSIKAGAKFIVTPSFNIDVVDYCINKKIPIFPGCSSTSEIDLALRKGLTYLKFFPAEASGGTEFLKSINGPYPKAKFIPTGGINLTNITSYLKLNNVIACGGSWLTKVKDGEALDLSLFKKNSKQVIYKIMGLEIVSLPNLNNKNEDLSINNNLIVKAQDLKRTLFQVKKLGYTVRENHISFEVINNSGFKIIILKEEFI